MPAGLEPLPDSSASPSQPVNQPELGESKLSNGARRWREATVIANTNQPYPTPEHSDDPFPGQMKWEADTERCPYPGCTKQMTDVGPDQRPDHLFHHYKDSMYDRLWELFGETHDLSVCPWESCDFAIQDPKDFARHLDGHCTDSDRCCVVDENGVCGHTFSTDARAHLELTHGLLAAPDDSEDFVSYCRICYHWITGQEPIENHYADHLPWIMRNVGRRARLLGGTGFLRNAHLCPKCLGDEALPASKRLKYHADQAAHIGEHILSVPQDEKVLCWMPGCTATGEWYPLQLADHHYAAHGINLMKNPEDARWLFISDDATLMAMSDETRQLFEQGVCRSSV